MTGFKADTGVDLTQRQDGDAAAARGGGKGENRAVRHAPPAPINLPFITADANGPKHLDMTLTRAKFNELTADLVEATMGPVKQALSATAACSASQIDKVLLVGGSTRIPAVQEAVKKLHRQGALQGHQPRRMRRHGRGHPGRRAGRRGQGPAAAGRHPSCLWAWKPWAAC